MTTTKQSWFKRSLAVLLAIMMVMSMSMTNALAADFSTKTSSLIEITVTETTEVGATIHIKNNKDYGTNHDCFVVVITNIPPFIILNYSSP